MAILKVEEYFRIYINMDIQRILTDKLKQNLKHYSLKFVIIEH